MIERHIVSSKSALSKFLQTERSSLARAPILIISSGVGASGTIIPSIDHTCRKAQFLTSMQMALRTVQSSITSAFPTTNQVRSQIELAKRTGATTIMGVGSGAAMDLTKAVLQKYNGKGILVPCTYGAVIASTSSLPILLDTAEEALVPQDDSHENDTAVVIETDVLDYAHGKEAAWACLAIGMDSLYRSPDSAHAMLLLEHGLKALEDESHLPEVLICAGRALDYGLNDCLRSSPLALAVSLIPSCFPNASAVTFFASLLPGICQLNSASSDLEIQVQRKSKEFESDIPSLASLVLHSDAAQSVSTLLSHVHSNRALWQCLDVDDEVLEAILHYSLNR